MKLQALLAACLFNLPAPLALAADTALQAATNALIEQKLDESGIAGAAAAIIVNGELAWMRGYGFADRESGLPFTPDTVINIASISKTFIGVAMMRAVAEGKLALDEDINTYLPFDVVNPLHPQDNITLRQLATHTSSIRDEWSVYAQTYYFDGVAAESPGDFLRDYFMPDGKHYAEENFLDARPGTKREYSNIGAELAAYIVELAVGRKFDVYMREQVLDPLGMNATGWFLSEYAPGEHARLYMGISGMAVPIEHYELVNYPGNVRTSVADLAKFFGALLNDGVYGGVRIIDSASLAEMQRLQYSEGQPDNIILAETNSGLFWQSRFNVTRMGHNGSDPGVRTWMLTNLGQDIGVILFSNTSLQGEDELRHVEIFQELWKLAEALKAEG